MTRDLILEHIPLERLETRLLKRIYQHSGITKRHSVVNDFLPDSEGGPFFDPADNQLKTPSTKVRNDLYIEHGKQLFYEAGCKVLESSGIARSDVTHVITASCTGFFAPGPDYVLVRKLGLAPSTRRYHIGFMGCFAAFPALRMAQSICQAEPDANVLVVCSELCTLHLKYTTNMDDMVATSVFADGAAGALVSSTRVNTDTPCLAIDTLATTLTPEGEGDMAWTIGDSGFDIVLSTYVPDIIKANIGSVLEPLFEQYNLNQDDIAHWAVHPGGRAILDKLARALELTDAHLGPSRQVLNDYGNMSSATILFVLRETLARAQTGAKVLGLAFGPGLTVESGLFQVV
jgi:predicted naringenin-chalcone synthase